MSFLQNTIQQIKASLGLNETSTEIDIEDISSNDLQNARDKLLEAVTQAAEDGTITPAELRAIRQLQTRLGISFREMNRIKLLVIQGMVEQILEDDIVTIQEFTMLKNIVNSLYPKDEMKSHSRFVGEVEFEEEDEYFEVFEEEEEADFSEEIQVAVGAFATSEVAETVFEENTATEDENYSDES